MHDVKAILSSHFMLKHLPPAELEKLARLVSTRTYEAGEPIFCKGDPGTAMMGVLKGRVRICSCSFNGREVVLNVIGAGEVFGEIAMIDGGERTADAVAMDTTDLLILSRRDFLPFLERNPSICVQLLEVMCQRLRWTSQQLEDINFLDLRARLAKRLLGLVDSHAMNASVRGADAGVRIAQHTLASMIGASREAVNQQLRSWCQEGVIEQNRGLITLRDRGYLRKIIEERL